MSKQRKMTQLRLRRGTATADHVDTMLDNYKRVEGSPTFMM